MKVIVTKNLNVRAGAPSVNAPSFRYLAPGREIEVDGNMYKGDRYDDIDTWLKDKAGNYYWSGGVMMATDEKMQITDPLFSLMNYNQSILNIPEEWRLTNGIGIKVAVLDTGINSSHADFRGIFNAGNVIDFTGNQSGTNDVFNHGTHIAGLIGARSGNNNGIIGIAPACSLYILRVGDDNGDFLPDNLIKALNWVASNDIQLVNMSFSINYKRYQKILSVLNDIQNCVMVAAAGENELLAKSNFFYPAMHPKVMAVGALNQPVLSGFNPQLDYILPLIPMPSCSGKDQNLYITESGSSMATAVLTGIIALYLSAVKPPDLQKAAIKQEIDKYSVEYHQNMELNNLQLIKP